MIAILQEGNYDILHYNVLYDYCVIDKDIPTVCHFDNIDHVEIGNDVVGSDNAYDFNFMFQFFNYKRIKDEKDAVNTLNDELLDSIDLCSLLKNEVQRWKNYMAEHDPDEFNRLMDIERELVLNKCPVEFVASNECEIDISQKYSIADRGAKWNNISKVIKANISHQDSIDTVLKKITDDEYLDDNIVENVPQEHNVLTALAEEAGKIKKADNYLLLYDIGIRPYGREDIIFKDSVLSNTHDKYLIFEDGLNITSVIKRASAFEDGSPYLANLKAICKYFQKTDRVITYVIDNEKSDLQKLITKSKMFYDVKYNAFCIQVCPTDNHIVSTATIYSCWNNAYNIDFLKLNIKAINNSM